MSCTCVPNKVLSECAVNMKSLLLVFLVGVCQFVTVFTIHPVTRDTVWCYSIWRSMVALLHLCVSGPLRNRGRNFSEAGSNEVARCKEGGGDKTQLAGELLSRAVATNADSCGVLCARARLRAGYWPSVNFASGMSREQRNRICARDFTDHLLY